jgi:hypothetical protein
MRSRGMKWMVHVPLLRETRMHKTIGWENQNLRDNLEDLAIDRSILKWILKTHGGAVWAGVIWLNTGTYIGVFEHGNKYCYIRRCDGVQSGRATDCSPDTLPSICTVEDTRWRPRQTTNYLPKLGKVCHIRKMLLRSIWHAFKYNILVK